MTAPAQPQAPPGGLTLTVNPGQFVAIGDGIFVEVSNVEAYIDGQVVQITGARCKLRFVAPHGVLIERSSRKRRNDASE